MSKTPTYKCEKCGKIEELIERATPGTYWPAQFCARCGLKLCEDCLPFGRGTKCLDCENAPEDDDRG